jgi:hypothetical protein
MDFTRRILMKKKGFFEKFLAALMIAALLFLPGASLAFAEDGAGAPEETAGDFVGITFTDPSMFSYTYEVGETPPVNPIYLEVDGYTDDEPPQHMPLPDPDAVTWYSTDDTVATVTSESTTSGTAIAYVTISTRVVGEADVYAHYDDGTYDYEVYSHIVVSAPGPSYVTIDYLAVTYGSGNLSNFCIDNLKVPLFDISDKLGFDDSSVLKDSVTALHALLIALETEYNPGWVYGEEWEWCLASKRNVVIDYGGAYVYTISDNDRTYDNNWVYYIDGSMPGVAACQWALVGGEEEEWRFLGTAPSLGTAPNNQ